MKKITLILIIILFLPPPAFAQEQNNTNSNFLDNLSGGLSQLISGQVAVKLDQPADNFKTSDLPKFKIISTKPEDQIQAKLIRSANSEVIPVKLEKNSDNEYQVKSEGILPSGNYDLTVTAPESFFYNRTLNQHFTVGAYKLEDNNLKKEDLEKLKPKKAEGTKFKMTSLDNHSMEVGTERHSPPKPYLKLNKWDSEVSLKVTVPVETTDQPEVLGDKLKYQGNKVSVEFYPETPKEVKTKDSNGNDQTSTMNEDGGVEFDTILEEKPVSNVFEFPIESSNLDYYYQPPLNQETKDPKLTCSETECKDKDGRITKYRPENVVGSYAVYYAPQEKMIKNKEEGDKYRTGKAFHIYRPKVTDAKGNTTWGILSINNQTSQLQPPNPSLTSLTITIPQDFLNKASYPVTIDPNFGYETAAKTQGFSSGTNSYLGYLFTSPSNTATGVSMTMYTGGYFGAGSIKGVIHLHSDLSLLANAVTPATVVPNDLSWVTTGSFSVAPNITPSTDYLLGVTLSSYYLYPQYDSGTAHYAHYGTVNYATPGSITGSWDGSEKYAIYATYTTPTPTPTPSPTPSPTPTPTSTPTPFPAMRFSGVKMNGLKIN